MDSMVFAIFNNRLLDRFKGKLTSKWGNINKCSQDTALRDIQDLIRKDILQKEESGVMNILSKIII